MILVQCQSKRENELLGNTDPFLSGKLSPLKFSQGTGGSVRYDENILDLVQLHEKEIESQSTDLNSGHGCNGQNLFSTFVPFGLEQLVDTENQN